MRLPNLKKGIAIYIAIVAVSAMVLMAFAISDIAFKEQVISYSGRDSRVAFYAANAGIECVLYHDFGGGATGAFQFATTSGAITGDMRCADGIVQTSTDTDDQNDSNPVNDVTTTSFYFNMAAIASTFDACAIVKISKTQGDPAAGVYRVTNIESRGYNNTCEGTPDNPHLSSEGKRNLERAFLMTYR